MPPRTLQIRLSERRFYKLYVFILLLIVYLSSCSTLPKTNFSDFNFSFNNTMSIFLLKNEKGHFFCIPVQYIGEFQLNNFDFTSGNILIGDFNIQLSKENTIIYKYYYETEEALNQYDIFIEKHLTDEELSNITGEYNRGNVQSSLSIWFNLIIDNEEQKGSGMMDYFELVRGEPNMQLNHYIYLFPHFGFFRTKYNLNKE